MHRCIYNEIIKFIYGAFFDDALTHIQKNNVSCTGAKCITINTAHTQSFTTHYRKTQPIFTGFIKEISKCYCEIITVNKYSKLG